MSQNNAEDGIGNPGITETSSEPYRSKFTQVQCHGFQSQLIFSRLTASLTKEHPLYHLAQQIESFEETLRKSNSVHLRNTRALLGFHDVAGGNISYPSIGPCYEIATNLLSAYRLLDCVATDPSIASLSLPPAPSNILRPVTWTSAILQSFKGWDAVQNWPNTLQQARNIVCSSPAQDLGRHQVMNASVMLTLLRSLSSAHQTKKYYTICGNFEAAALHLSVLREADWPSSSDNGIQGVDERLAVLTMDLSTSLDDQRLVKFVKTMGKNMRVPLQLALIVSPIYLLSTSTLYKKGPNQTDLWRLCTSVGNNKPVMLRKVESAIWKAVWNISKHGNARVELQQLFCSPEWRNWENTTDPNNGVLFFRAIDTTLSPRRSAFITEVPESTMVEETPEPFTSAKQQSALHFMTSQPRLLLPAPPPSSASEEIQPNLHNPNIGERQGNEATTRANDDKVLEDKTSESTTSTTAPVNLVAPVNDIRRQRELGGGTDEDICSVKKDMGDGMDDEKDIDCERKDMESRMDKDIEEGVSTHMNTTADGPVVDAERAAETSDKDEPPPVHSTDSEKKCTSTQELEEDEDRELSEPDKSSHGDIANNGIPGPVQNISELPPDIAKGMDKKIGCGDEDMEENVDAAMDVTPDGPVEHSERTIGGLNEDDPASMGSADGEEELVSTQLNEMVKEVEITDTSEDGPKQSKTFKELEGDKDSESSERDKSSHEDIAKNKIPDLGQLTRELHSRIAKNKAKLSPAMFYPSTPKGKARRRVKSSASNGQVEIESAKPSASNDQVGHNDDDDDIVFIGVERPVFFNRPQMTLDLEEKVTSHRSHIQPLAYTATGKAYKLDLISHDSQSLATLEEISDMMRGRPAFLTDPDNSMIRIMDREHYNNLGAEELLSILREQHIVIKDREVSCPMKNKKSDSFRAALCDLGCLTSPQTVHDLSIVPEDGNLNLRTRRGTLRQIYQASCKGIDKILNVLDIPMEMKGMRNLEVSTDYLALYKTMGDWKTSSPFAAGHSRWGLVATKGALHGWHIDSNGLGTYIETKCGAKLWVLGRPKDPQNKRLDSTDFFLSESYDLNGSCRSLLDVEAILLVPGTELIMKPNTLHMVYTPFDSVCHGGHFYSAGNMVDSLSGIIHTFVAGKVLTNTNHVHSRLHLQQMISMYHKVYVEDSFFLEDPCMKHVPDDDDWVGVMNILVLCIYAMLMNVLDHNTYYPTFRGARDGTPMTPVERKIWQENDIYAMIYQERKACMHTRGQAIEIMEWFQDHFDVVQEGLVENMSVFQNKLLAHYCSMILSYKIAAVEQQHEGPPGCTVDDVRVQLMGVGSGPLNMYLQSMLKRKQGGAVNLAPFLNVEKSFVPKESQPMKGTKKGGRDDVWLLGKSKRDEVFLDAIGNVKQESGPPIKKVRFE